MKVTLLTRESSIKDMEDFTVTAALTCHANTDKQVVNESLLTRIIKLGHESILEHIYLTYSIKGLSRACLQELARHRHITLSVESTRHTLRKFLLRHNSVEVCGTKYKREIADAFDEFARKHKDMTNDELKYYIPEFWPTNLIMTVNVRELRHILDLRTAPQALKEFRDLAHALFNVIPNEFKYLLQDCVHEETSHE